MDLAEGTVKTHQELALFLTRSISDLLLRSNFTGTRRDLEEETLGACSCMGLPCCSHVSRGHRSPLQGKPC